MLALTLNLNTNIIFCSKITKPIPAEKIIIHLLRKLKLQTTELSFQIVSDSEREFLFKTDQSVSKTHPTTYFILKSPEVNTTKNSAFKTCSRRKYNCVRNSKFSITTRKMFRISYLVRCPLLLSTWDK